MNISSVGKRLALLKAIKQLADSTPGASTVASAAATAGSAPAAAPGGKAAISTSGTLKKSSGAVNSPVAAALEVAAASTNNAKLPTDELAKQYAVATTAYTATAKDELSLAVGDVICVIRRGGEFWFGELRGARGWAPERCLEVMPNSVRARIISAPCAHRDFIFGF